MRIAIDKLRMAREHDPSLAVREVNDAHIDALRQSMVKNNVNSNSSLSFVVVVPTPNWTDPRKMSEKDMLVGQVQCLRDWREPPSGCNAIATQSVASSHAMQKHPVRGDGRAGR